MVAKSLDPLKLPKLELHDTVGERLLEIGGVAGLIILWGMIYYAWPHLPEKIPHHFGPSGVPDAWGSKSLIFLLPTIGSVLYLVLSIVKYFPHTYNYPYPITEANYEAQYRNARNLMNWLKVEIVTVFAYITWITIQVSLGKDTGLGTWFLPIFLVIIFGTLITYLVKGSKIK